MSVSIPVALRFLAAFINSPSCPGTISGMELFRKYIDFHAAGCYRNPLTVTAFGRSLRDIRGVEKVHARTGVVYRLEPSQIRDYLTQSRQYDDDASLA